MIFALLTRLWSIRWLRFGVIGAGALLAFAVWLHFHDAAVRREQRAIDRAAYEKALGEAELLAIKAKTDAEEHYRRLADEADDRAQKTVAGARAAADRYIMRAKSRGCSAIATPAAPGSDAATSADGPGEPADLVEVTDDDVRICSENTARLVEAREWALGL